MAVAQSTIDPPYHLNGSAYKENCNCYTLTTENNNQSGSVWNMNKISLASSFDFRFDVFLGCKDADGADGLVFVLQPISTNVGTLGAGIGFEGVRPSIGIALDTWQNSDLNDPVYDHISIQKNGDNNHASSNNLAGPVTALANGNNIEDCQWHTFRIIWDAASRTISAYVDNSLRVSHTIDLVSEVFNNDPQVFWGFTSATGGSNNHHRFCTSLKSDFQQLASIETCAPQEIQFVDQSSSFGTIVEWKWDFGDGTQSSEQNPPPHYYAEPGNYTVSSVVLGNNGCWSDTVKQVVTVGSIPQPDFLVPDTICGSGMLQPTDQSSVEYGTINQWNWVVNGTAYNGAAPPPLGVSGNTQIPIQLSVRTLQGCESEIVEKMVQVLEKPIAALSIPISATCVGDQQIIEVESMLASNPVQEWEWASNIGMANQQQMNLYSSAPGEFFITVRGRGENGCWSDEQQHIASFFTTNANAGRDTMVAINQPLQLNGSGGPYFSWSPASLIDAPNTANPVATLPEPTDLVLTTYTDIGCETRDTIKVRVYKGPEIYVPNAFTPNGDGKNDRLHFLAIGMRSVTYCRIFNRYGQLVYEGNIGDGWDGTINGVAQPAGSYVWMVAGIDFAGQPHQKKGHLLLIR